MNEKHYLYDCGICGGLHPWEWDGDCRDDANRYSDTLDYAERNGVSDYDVVEVSWEDRQNADYETDPEYLDALQRFLEVIM